MDRRTKIILAIVLFITVAALSGIGVLVLLALALQPSGIAVIEVSMTGSFHDVALSLTVSNDDRRALLRDIYVTLDGLPKDVLCRSVKCDHVTSSANVTYERFGAQHRRHVIVSRFSPPVDLKQSENVVFTFMITSSVSHIESVTGSVVYRGASMIGIHQYSFHPVAFVVERNSMRRVRDCLIP